jgi:hypothetical protein
MESSVPIGTKRMIDGRLRVFYYGYWVKAYEAPADTLQAKKWLLEALTRRLFNHVEHGINVPGKRLGEARRCFEAEPDPQRRRVKGAMLAGALFNRASDIFTKLVEMQALGVEVEPDNTLMRECDEHLQEALSLGQMVLHRSGEEGLDELWGEPFKAFAYPIEEFYKSRYVKIAQTMEAIDRIRDALVQTFGAVSGFGGVASLLAEFAERAKVKSETLRTDAEIFDVWTSFVVAAEKLVAFRPSAPSASHDPSSADEQRIAYGLELIRAGKDVISHMTRSRVPMPKTVAEFVAQCERYRDAAPPSAQGYRARPALSASHP